MKDNLPKEAVRLVSHTLLAPIDSVETEIQDGGSFLLVTVSVSNRLQLPITSALRTELIDRLGKLIPPKDNGEYSWMLIVKGEGTVDSVMAELQVQ